MLHCTLARFNIASCSLFALHLRPCLHCIVRLCSGGFNIASSPAFALHLGSVLRCICLRCNIASFASLALHIGLFLHCIWGRCYIASRVLHACVRFALHLGPFLHCTSARFNIACGSSFCIAFPSGFTLHHCIAYLLPLEGFWFASCTVSQGISNNVVLLPPGDGRFQEQFLSSSLQDFSAWNPAKRILGSEIFRSKNVWQTFRGTRRLRPGD